MDRDSLIQQVKSEYARSAQSENHKYVTNQSYSGVSPETYYKKTLEKAARDTSTGKCDNCVSDQQVVERVANRSVKARRIQNTTGSTLHNMEVAEEAIALKSDDKNTQDLKEKNERRTEVIPRMIREMKEELTREELDAESPNVIGGGGNE